MGMDFRLLVEGAITTLGLCVLLVGLVGMGFRLLVEGATKTPGLCVLLVGMCAVSAWGLLDRVSILGNGVTPGACRKQNMVSNRLRKL